MDWFKSLARKQRTLRKLSRENRTLLLQALLLFPLVAASLRLFGMARTQSILSRMMKIGLGKSTRSSPNQLEETVRLVDAAHRYNRLWSNCLKRSMVLWFFLRRRRIEADLRIGVRRSRRGLDAHAWLEYRGLVVNDDKDVHEHFAVFNSSISDCYL
jgi:hypothetical protein